MSKRAVLQQRDGLRFRCRAFVERFGMRKAFRGPDQPTVLLRDIVDAENALPLTEHLWFVCGKWSAGLVPGDTLEFDARATPYLKGYRGRRDIPDASPVTRDWRLERPTKVAVLRSVSTTTQEPRP